MLSVVILGVQGRGGENIKMPKSLHVKMIKKITK